MKLFQKLLLAPAALGLFAPVVANANESNFRDVTNYTQDTVEVSLDTFKPLSSKNPLLAGGEGAPQNGSAGNEFDVDTFSSTTTASFGSNFALATIDGETSVEQEAAINFDWNVALSSKNPLLAGGEGAPQNGSAVNDFDVDTFSSTTTASFGSNFALATIDGETSVEQEAAINFDWNVALSSSFTGNDSLDVVLISGVSALFPELDMDNTSAKVEVDSISYTNSLSDRVTAFFASGNGTVGSALYNTACVYGGVADTFGDCGVASANIDEGLGTALGANFNFENGLSFSVGYEGQGMASGEVGLLSENGADAIGGQIAYTADSYGVSVSVATIDNHSAANVRSAGQTQSTGVNAYYTPDLASFPSISVGFETSHDNSVTGTTNDETSHYFFGLQWDEVGDGTLGAALGSKEPTAENSDAQTMYEVFYSYNYADGITVTPFYYSKDNTGTTASETGIGVKTSFSF